MAAQSKAGFVCQWAEMSAATGHFKIMAAIGHSPKLAALPPTCRRAGVPKDAAPFGQSVLRARDRVDAPGAHTRRCGPCCCAPHCLAHPGRTEPGCLCLWQLQACNSCQQPHNL
eukprot:1151186-Pelagomonas_calceolata.AAC.11